MCSQTLNLFGQERHLNLGGAGVSLMDVKLLDYFVFTFRFLHAQPFFLFVLLSSPLTCRFPSVKVITLAPVATAPAATRRRQSVHHRQTRGVPSHAPTQCKGDHVKQFAAHGGAVPPSQGRLTTRDSHAVPAPRKESGECLVLLGRREERRGLPR